MQAEVALKSGVKHRAILSVGSAGALESVRVAAAEPPPAGRTVVLRGEAALDPRSSSPSGAFEARIPFEAPTAGVLDMAVDWGAPTNHVLAHVCPGLMQAGLGCVPVIDGNRVADSKPLLASAPVGAGTYTLWITNPGPGRERVRYEVGLTP